MNDEKPDTIILIRYPDGKALNEYVKFVFNTMPDLLNLAKSFEVTRGSSPIVAGGDGPVATLRVVINETDENLPYSVQDIVRMTKDHDIDLFLEIHNAKKWWQFWKNGFVKKL